MADNRGLHNGRVVIPTEAEAAKCFDYYGRLIEPIRATARALGYAIGVHGSCGRDIDLIAVPWVKDVATPQELAVAIRKTAESVVGCCFVAPHEDGDYFRAGCPGMKDHGRLVFSLHLLGTAGPYIDLSVMPTRAEMTGQEIVAAREVETRKRKETHS